MNRHELLAGIHAAVTPRSYLEIGVNDGRSLSRSQTRTIGVDPEFEISAELACDLQLVRATSDDFFARNDAIAWFPDGVIDLAFVDGLHIFEFALRDFMNTERLSSPTGVIIMDDMLPRSDLEAARDRVTGEWAGDVYKVALVLEKYRPDLTVVPINTAPTGLLLVIGLDPTSTVLVDRYDEILAEFAVPDPQHVPREIIHRTAAADPATLLASPLWADLTAARSTGDLPASVREIAALRGTAEFVWQQPSHKPYTGGEGARRPKADARPAAAKKAAAKKVARRAAKKAPAKKTASKRGAAKKAARKAAALRAANPPSLLSRVRKALKNRL